MNDQQQTTGQPGGDPASPRRFQDFGSVRRPRDDRMIAGVSTAVGRWWNIDPVIVRIGFVVLTFIGLSGVILYAAAWLLLPEEGKDRSVVGETFGLGDNDEQVRTIGLIVAAALAGAAALGDSAWGFNGWGWAVVWITIWVGLPIAFVYWLVKGRHDARAQVPPPPTPPAGPAAPGSDPTPAKEDDTVSIDQTLPVRYEPPAGPPPGEGPGEPTGAAPPPPQAPRRGWSPALFLGTISLTFIAWGALWIWSLQTEPVAASVYVFVGLVITALGLLVGSVVGDAGLLIPVGLVLTVALAVTSALPSARAGDYRFVPVNAEQATRTLETGAGQVTYDLTQIRDLDDLAGESVRIEHGAGVVRVIVPRELDVDVDAQVRWGGQVMVFDRRDEGWDARIAFPADGDEPFDIQITSTVGVIEVIRS
ncbi:PspC domain-containing protein [Aeromicrobium phragmitis]|nr:PspC domain-containing protein [Aeromicrobium phragmitis]